MQKNFIQLSFCSLIKDSVTRFFFNTPYFKIRSIYCEIYLFICKCDILAFTSAIIPIKGLQHFLINDEQLFK